MSPELRTSLWNVLCVHVWRESGSFLTSHDGRSLAVDLWFEYYKLPLDQLPSGGKAVYAEIRSRFFACSWNEVYDFLEWLLNHVNDEVLNQHVNHILEAELASFRFVASVFTEITAKIEIDLIEEALKQDKYQGAREHLETALKLMSRRDNPDYRNSIKESISAVESVAGVVSGKKKPKLGDALSVLRVEHGLHPALEEGFKKIYGYTSDGGIRHAMHDLPNLTASDAKFFLLICTSFVNYLKSKME